MKKNKNFNFLMVAHALLSSALAIILLFLSSCFEATPDPTSFGQEVSPQSVADTLNSSLSGLDANTIQNGEFVHFEANQSINGGTKFVTKDTGITVISRTDTGSAIDITLAFEEVSYDSEGNSTRSVFQDTVSLPKASSSQFKAASLAQRFFPKSELRAKNTSLCQPVISDDVTFHNLSVSASQLQVPSSVQSSPFCSGQTTCTVAAVSINFDQVLWSGDEGDKIKCQYTYSVGVPYLAAQMQQCITAAIPIEDRSVLVTECTDVFNFSTGS